MLELGLKPVPSPEWQAEWDELMRDPWLRHKTDRERRLREHFAYCQKYLPMLTTGPRGWFVDIGPGCGETLEIARGMHYWALGIDAASGDGGMGEQYSLASHLMHQRQGLDVRYGGFLPWLDKYPLSLADEESIVAFNSRGSWEQAWSDFMVGEPHDKHHDCKRLSWLIDQMLEVRLARELQTMFYMLMSGGVFMLAMNGSANADEYDRLMVRTAQDAGFRIDLHEPPTILRLVKP